MTRRSLLKSGAGLAAILSAGRAPAAIVRSMLAARQTITVNENRQMPDIRALRFVARAAGSTVAMAAGSSAPVVTLEYSRDGQNWLPFTSGESTITLPQIGDFAFLRAGPDGNLRMAAGSSGVVNANRFILTGSVGVGGDITALLNRNAPIMLLPYTCFFMLFYNCAALADAKDMVFPSTSLGNSCYAFMFNGCTSLVSVPELQATTLYSNCYQRMFYGCTNLNEISTRHTEWSPTNATANWVGGVAATGTFRCPSALGDNETISRGTSACPSGWTVVNQ